MFETLIIKAGVCAASYTIVPICGYAASHVGALAGAQIVRTAYQCGADKVKGLITLSLKKNRNYVILRGETVELDPRKKYVIVRGELREIDDLECDDGWVGLEKIEN